MSAITNHKGTSPLLEKPSSPSTVDDPDRKRALRRRNRATRPELGSLYGVLCENSGASLYVLPILWTDLHSRLLNVQFNKQTPRDTAASAKNGLFSKRDKLQTYSSDTMDTLTSELRSLLSPQDTRPFCKSRAIKRLLSVMYPATMSRPKSVVELDLHFGQRVFRSAMRVSVVWKCGEGAEMSFDSAVTRPISSVGISQNDGPGGINVASCHSSQNTTGGPMVAYVNRSHLFMIRQNLFRIVPGPESGDHKNTPVTRLQCLRSKQLLPTDLDRDAYLIGVFLAMAQSQFYEGSRKPSQSVFSLFKDYPPAPAPTTPTPEFQDVKLRVLTHDDDTLEFIVYSTTMPAAFLQRFAEPTKAPSSASVLSCAAQETGLQIEYTRVPAWPIQGLKERLGRALGRDVSGDVGEEEEDEEAKSAVSTQEASPVKAAAAAAAVSSASQPAGSLKRKRARTLTDIFSVSFDDSSAPAANGASIGGSNSPTLSPRGKRRRTVSSSLAVF